MLSNRNSKRKALLQILLFRFAHFREKLPILGRAGIGASWERLREGLPQDMTSSRTVRLKS
jgi:hypothetical protein